MKQVVPLSLFIVLLIPALGASQVPRAPGLTRTTISISDGSPSSTILALCYDDQGLLMVGTTSGLARYDGDRFETFLSADHPGLDGDRILALHRDAAGRIWVGSKNAATSVLEDDQFHRIGDGQLLHSVHQFHRASDSALWLAGNRLGRFQDGELEVFGEEDGLPASRLARVVEDGSGTLWAATQDGVFRLGPGGFACVDDRPSRWLTTDFDGFVWTQIGTGELVALSGPPSEPIALGQVQLYDEMPHVASVRLVATSNGLFTMTRGSEPGKRLKVERAYSTSDQGKLLGATTCLLPGPGPSHDLWMGTELQGLQFVENRYVGLMDLYPEFPGRPVSLVHQLADGAVLVNGGFQRAAFLLDVARHRTPIEVRDPEDYHSTSVASTAAGTWFSTRGGLARLEDGAIVPDPRWRGAAGPVVASADGSVWLPFEGRLEQIAAPPDSTGELASFPLPPSGIQLLCPWRGSFLASCRDEILHLDRTSGQWSAVAKLEGAALRQLRPGPRGEIWISTYGQGLWRLGAEGRLDHWSKSACLPDPFLAWIAPIDDSGDLWVNSNSGLIRLSIASLDAHAAGEAPCVDAQSFSAPEANGARGALLGDGTLVLPTLEGIALFDRSAVPPPSASPRVLIRGPYVDGDSSKVPGHYHGTVNLRYEFSAPIFPTSSSSSFQYRIAEFGERWIDAGAARSVRFPNLGSGSYTLEVRARTPRSTWSAPARSMTLTVSPFWFDSAWVRWLIAGSALFALQCVILGRMRSLRRRNQTLTKEMDQRWAAEARLVASERRFRRLFHTAPSAILAWTPSGVLLDRNERANELFAWGHDEVIEGEPWELFEDADIGKDTVDRAFVECEDITVVAMTKAGDFQTKRCRWQFAPTRAESGEVTSIIATISDLSRRDQDARTLAGLRENLARAEESERSRIARELHDDLSQRLVALAIDAQLLDLDRATSDPAATQSVRSFQTEIENVAKHLHSLSRQLHPTIVNDLGLVAALRSECSRRNRTGGIPVTLSVVADVVEPPTETALALFRIAQEAIRNASRHSGATAIEVTLKMSGDWLELSVRDDGKGICPGESKNKGGIGMNSMAERARLAGGDFHVRSTPGIGTCITAKVPGHPEAQRRAMALRGE